jgi:hypothetical protein
MSALKRVTDSSRTSRHCQKQTKKAATFDAVWRFSERYADPYVSDSDLKNIFWDLWPHHDETSKERAYCGVVVSKKLKLTALLYRLARTLAPICDGARDRRFSKMT